MTYDKNLSPVGWYVVSYLLRFVELNDDRKDDDEARFLSWENTILVRASTLDEAYKKVCRLLARVRNHTRVGLKVYLFNGSW